MHHCPGTAVASPNFLLAAWVFYCIVLYDSQCGADVLCAVI